MLPGALLAPNSNKTVPSRGNGCTAACAVAEVNIQSGQGLQIASVFQSTGVDCGVAQALSQRFDRRLCGLVVACIEDGEGLIAELGALRQDLGKQGVERLDDVCARHSTGNLFRCGCAMANGQAHVVRSQWIGNVDNNFACQVAHRAQCTGSICVAGG